MRRADVFMQDVKAGILEEIKKGKKYTFTYLDGYTGRPISLTLPTTKKQYVFDAFPSFFDGLLPEGMLLEGLLRIRKIDADDYFSQLMAVGEDMVGAVTVREIK